jgi:hypothetical protein
MAACGRVCIFGISTVVAAAALLFAAGSSPGEVRSPGIDVVGTTLRVQLPDGTLREGPALVGGVLNVMVGGSALRVKIAGVEKDSRDRSGEILLYDFRVVAPDGREEPLCSPDPDGRRLGLALAGRSDPAGILTVGEPGVFELVCTSGPQGKCVRFGYAPWRKAPDGRPLTDWFNACVRMLRGDYCGDGRPFTRDGTWIDLYDRIGILKSDEDPSLTFEAAWGPGGAVCVAKTRLKDLIDLDGLAKACPRLARQTGPEVCTDRSEGGLIFNRSR